MESEVPDDLRRGEAAAAWRKSLAARMEGGVPLSARGDPGDNLWQPRVLVGSADLIAAFEVRHTSHDGRDVPCHFET